MWDLQTLLDLMEEKDQTKALYESTKQSGKSAEEAALRDALRRNYNEALREFSRELLTEMNKLEQVSRSLTGTMRAYLPSKSNAARR